MWLIQRHRIGAYLIKGGGYWLFVEYFDWMTIHFYKRRLIMAIRLGSYNGLDCMCLMDSYGHMASFQAFDEN